MKKRSKIILFLVCMGVFLLTAPLTIFYSQGYRFDLKEKKITQTGGLFLKARPKKADIYINGRDIKQTDFLFGSALIENLLPGRYEIAVKKDGFQKWEKNLPIEQKKVTEAKNIILWPENLSFDALASGVKKMYLSPDKTKAIFLEIEKLQPFPIRSPSAASSSPSSAVTPALPHSKIKKNLKLYDLERKVKSRLISSDDFKEKEIEFSDLIWLPDSQNVLLEIATREQLKYFLLQIFPRPRLSPLTFLPKDVSKIEPNPQEPQKIFFQKLQRANTLNSLFWADLNEKKVSPAPVSKNFITFAVGERNLYWLESNGFLYGSDFSGQGKEKINQEPLKIQKGEVPYKIWLNQDYIFLQEGEDLFYFDQETRSFKKIFEGVSSIAFSSDNKKLAIAKDHEIWIFFLEKDFGQPRRKKGEKVFLTRFSEKIGRILWINSDYLLFEIEGKIKIIEIDDRDKPQTWDLAEFKTPEIFFNQNNKKLYILTEEKLSVSEPLF